VKKQVSPAVVVLVVVLAFGTVLSVYWKGLLGHKEGPAGKMAGGGGPAIPPPPIVGLPQVTVTTLSGPRPDTPTANEGGLQDGASTQARFDGPSAVAAGADGVVFVTDSRNHRIRAVAPDGTVHTATGSGPTGTVMGAFADGPTPSARFWDPSGLALAPGGGLFIADTGNHRIRRLGGGVVRTLSGGDTPRDRLGLPDGAFADGPGASARFRYPVGVAMRSDGSVLVVDTGNRRLRRVAADGATSTLADLAAAGAKSPCGIALYPDGRALVADPAAEALYVVSAVGQVSELSGIDRAAPIWVRPTGVAISPQGVVYVADTGSHCVMRIPPGGAPQVVAGVVEVETPIPGFIDGTGDKAEFAAPCGIAMGPQGELYVSDFGNNAIRKIVVPPGV